MLENLLHYWSNLANGLHQSEYAQILAKRVGDVKAQKSEARSKFTRQASTKLYMLTALRAESFIDAQIEVEMGKDT